MNARKLASQLLGLTVEMDDGIMSESQFIDEAQFRIKAYARECVERDREEVERLYCDNFEHACLVEIDIEIQTP